MKQAGFWCCVCIACSEVGIRQPLPAAPAGAPQPVDPTVQTDVILQVTDPVVDVLWVLDNSPSMGYERLALAQAFPSFIEPFIESGADYHVGVITTDMDAEDQSGRLRIANGVRWVSPTDEAPDATFLSMATQAIHPIVEGHGAVRERGREAVFTALYDESLPGGYNEGFLRDDRDGWLHVTVVTDEDDDTDDQWLSPSTFAQFLLDQRARPQRVTFNSVVSWITLYGATRGDDYMEVTHMVGGQTASVHAVDWDAFLAELGGLQAPLSPREEFFLSRTPVVDTIRVRAITHEQVSLKYLPHVEYHYSELRNSIQFESTSLPPIGSRVEVTYTVR